MIAIAFRFFGTKTIKYLFNIFILCFCSFILFAQQNKIDSILSVLKSAKEDTNKVNTLNALGWQLMYSNPDTAILLGNQALVIAEKLPSTINHQPSAIFIATTFGQLGVYYYLKADYPKALDYYLKALKIDEALNNKEGIAKRLGNIGIVYANQADYPKALDYYFRALKTFEELGDKKGIATQLGNIGNVYDDQANYPKALDYYFRALKMDEALGNKNGIAANLGNIGIVYHEQGDYPKALDYYFKALKMNEELGRKSGIATNLGNIGLVYSEQGDYPKVHPVERDSLLNRALDYYFRALKIKEEIGDKNGIAITLGNIGLVYAEQAEAHPNPSQREGLYNKALDYYFKALKMKEELGDKNGIAIWLGNIGSLYIEAPSLPPPLGEKKKGYALAEKYLSEALKMDKEIGAMKQEMDVENYFTDLYSQTNRYQLALEHYKKAMVLKDSIFTMEKDKEITRKEMNYEFDKKEAATKAEQEKKDIIAKAELKQKEQQRNYFIIGFALVGLLAVFIFRSYRQKQKANVIITQQKIEVEKQKHIIEEKNKDITDSINYAKRIQQAKLPNKEEIISALPQSFILFKPKDIVSGDFYFYSPLERGKGCVSPLERGKGCVIAAADCTGHGVPGAFMSMIGSDKLEDAVSESSDTSEILSLLNKGIKTALKQSDSDESTRDGMDIALCSVEFPSPSERDGRVRLKYAGANRPLWIIRNGQTTVDEIKATKKAIGGFTEDSQHFNTHEIKLQQGDTFYIFSDGYADTFSSQEQGSKKITTKKFKEILLGIQHKTMQEQEQHLDNFVENWKAGIEQIDDILIIGIKIT